MHTRRQFLDRILGGSVLLSFADFAPRLWARSAAQVGFSGVDNGRVLVVIQLSGGNDGLNTVVPFQDDVYARNRPTLRLPAARVHRLNDQLGFHPRMQALKTCYDDGRLAVIQGVGYPKQDRNHETAMRVWHTADLDPVAQDTGWLGRAADELWAEIAPAAPAVFVGAIPRPLGLNAARTVVPAIHTIGDWLAAHDSSLEAPGVEPRGETDTSATTGNALLHHVEAAMTLAEEHRRRLEAIRVGSPSLARYPAHPLAQDLRTVAQLIRAEVGLRIFFTELGGGGIGGFDNHANQLGNHCALLEQLAESIGAFVAELAADRLLDRVLLLTFSEFGRTVAENGRRGTDHGAAGPMFILGGQVRPGLHGAHPSLIDLEAGALKHHTDFRSVYATVLEGWLGLDRVGVLGATFDGLPGLFDRSTAGSP